MPRKIGLTIWEGAVACWYYHLSTGGREDTLCGDKDVMPTSLPLDSWGFKSGHIPESYCRECERIAKEKGMI